jgi:phage-related protein
MAGEDYSVGTKVTADVSNFEKGMNKAEKSLKGFSDKLANSIDRLGKKGLIGSVANVTLAMQGLTKSFNTVIKFAKDVGKAINECTEAYKGQVIAERALDTAIQNNPFISGESSKALKQFASEMQRVSNYGDEELIPMMTNLVSLGRTETETMQIMSVAMDMSAGMGISLDTAITQLNATLNGNIGRLGQQNAELKGLTEEELKQGKAIEILGEKFKGLSSATADTSKQLQNIKGDFKEALGQFTLPSSDLWNKFWAGFYQRGIEAINKINAFMDSQIIGKKLANAITEQIARINPADIGGRIDYTRNVLRVIGDNELEALKNYLSGLRTLSAEQEIILKRIKAEEDSRYQSSINAKKEAEDKKKQADAEAQITAELQKQEEIASKKTDWASKLLDQRIEMLETERDRAMQFAEEEGRETYTIWRDYNNKILELKLERLEKEKKKALEEEGLTAEDKIDIEEYYSGETQKIYNDLGNYKKKKNDEEKKDEKSKFSIIVQYAKEYAKKIKQIVEKVVNTIKNVVSSGINIFKKLFDFNIDEVLDVVLQVEDSILTFFVETLPNLPRFVQSVLQSIRSLLKSLKNIIKRENIAEAVSSMLKSVGDSLPELVNDLLDILIDIIGGALDGLINWLDNGGFVVIFNTILSIQKKVEGFVTTALEDIADLLSDHTSDFADFLAESIASANRTLPSLIKSVLKIINALIETITKVFENEDFMNSIVDSIKGTIEEIIKILPQLIKSLVKLGVAIMKAIVPKIPEILSYILEDALPAIIEAILDIIQAIIPELPKIMMYLIDAIIEALPKIMDSIVKALTKIISSIAKKIFTIEFWQDVLSSFGEVLAGIFKSAFGGIGKAFESDSSTQTGSQAGDVALGLATGGISTLGHALGWWAKGTNNAPAGLSVVGEAGPELVKFRGGEQVLNNRNTNKALANMGGTTINQNVTFNNLQDTTAFAMMNQFKQYNRQLAINGIM